MSCHNEYIIRYCDVNKMAIVPLQLKTNSFFLGELHTFTNNDTVIPIQSDDKELFKKCREIQNTITKFIGVTLLILLKPQIMVINLLW